jgi:hypothetical protein
VFDTDSHLHPHILFKQNEKLKYKLLTLPTNIRQGWKCLTVTNTLAYYTLELITVVKTFTGETSGWKKFNAQFNNEDKVERTRY